VGIETDNTAMLVPYVLAGGFPGLLSGVGLLAVIAACGAGCAWALAAAGRDRLTDGPIAVIALLRQQVTGRAQF
jgi:hypothetical protein